MRLSSFARKAPQSAKLYIIGALLLAAFTLLGWESKIGKIGKSTIPLAKTFRMTTFTLEQTEIGKRTFRLVYDNQLISRIDLLDSDGNFVETQYSFEYDVNDNLINHIRSYGDQQKVTTYKYNEQGFLIAKTSSDDGAEIEPAIWNYVYDQNNVILAENNLNKDGAVLQHTSFSYPDVYTISTTTSAGADNQDSEEYHFSKDQKIPTSFSNFYYSFFTSPQFRQYNDNLIEKYVGDFGLEVKAPETCLFQYELDKNGNVIKQAYLFNNKITDVHTYTYEEI